MKINMEKMTSPLATYRIQFHRGFTFSDAKQIIPYLQELGVDCLYASPIFEAVPGSMHGYDVINPLRVNPELGSLDELRALSALCKAHKIQWIQDIVPNHMAFHPANKWLMDVLEKGKLSAFAPFFDTGFSSDFFSLPLMVPFLGSTLEEAIKKGQISLSIQEDRLMIRYFDQYYPLNIFGYKGVLAALDRKDTAIDHHLQEAILKITQNQIADGLQQDLWEDFFKVWRAFLYQEGAREMLKQVLIHQNKNKQYITRLCKQQWYRLCHWEESNTQINYRRFFTVNGLICLQPQHKAVFDLTHQLIKELVKEGIFQGLRIDHIDGLFDPEKYLNDLRNAVGEEVYIVVEKILESDERLPSSWPVAGTSGYDYLTQANNLFINHRNEHTFDRFYQQFIGEREDLAALRIAKKELILRDAMAGEADNLVRFLKQSSLLSRTQFQLVGEEVLHEAISKLLIYFPVYRFYGQRLPLPVCERERLAILFAQLRKDLPPLTEALLVLEKLLLIETPLRNGKRNTLLGYFYQRIMQFTGPLMAKGVEDTLMYTYNRFIGSNEVGNSPEHFGMTAKKFHAAMAYRQRNWPQAMNASATHDTKRGEDTRARLQALSCLPLAWKKLVRTLERVLSKDKSVILPAANDRYFIYQTLLGSVPAAWVHHDDYLVRLGDYLQKALREAKVNSNWIQPNEDYEQRCIDFAALLIDPQRGYWSLWSSFLLALSTGGMFNSLAQVLLKTMTPGIPDFYQGTEFWDLSFVDPDNRREVDYEERLKDLQMLNGNPLALLDYWKEQPDGKVKLLLINKLLGYRKDNATLFRNGAYLPIKVHGRYCKEVLAFCRRYKQQWSVCLIPLQAAAIAADQRCLIEEIDWKDTYIEWPADMPDQFRDVLNEKNGKAGSHLFLKEIFEGCLPLGVLHGKKEVPKRSAGVLMAISSLPSAYGIGDLGPQARIFASQLAAGGQRIWQLLPLNPSDSSTSYSPYSTYAVFAGNPLLISPEVLGDQALLSQEELHRFTLKSKSAMDYEKAVRLKERLLVLASKRFLLRKDSAAYHDFERFMEKEKGWLDDYALYLAIKRDQGGKPWYAWPEALKTRKKQATDAAAKKYADYLLTLKWQQYEFFKEWYALKTDVEVLSIQFLGDLPIYVNYDSVDVWCNRQLFSLDKTGHLQGIAGVPPDYFNAEGQLWGMPTFNWRRHEEQGYAWWISRFRKNMAWYHLIRLDHFRAFYNYWEVPAGKSNAKEGEWREGPQERFFKALKNALGTLPLIAEDLGDIDEGVIDLRDRFGLPGMKVLQFAFGADMSYSPHIPHEYNINSVAYTGTHDNNTVVGWFKELNGGDKKRVFSYLGHRANRTNIHQELIKMAYASVAFLAIIPLQDILGLGEEARINTPATVGMNWKWRLLPRQLKSKHTKWLYDLTRLYNR